MPYCYRFLISIFLLFSHSTFAQNELQFFTIGTGGITGVYYSAGTAICNLVNKRFSHHKMRCAVEVTAASVYNLKGVRNKSLRFGLVQAGIHYEAFEANGIFKSEKPYQSLRSIFSLHDEAFTILAGPNSGISTFDDLVGKNINIGAKGSGTRKGSLELLNFSGFSLNEFELDNFRPDNNTTALCKGEIDAYIYMVGHPARNIRESTSRCQAKIIALSDVLNKNLEDIPYYSKFIIPGGLYKHNEEDVSTYSVKATLVTDEDTGEEMVYQLVKSVFSKIEQFKKMHPAFANLNVDNMVSKGLSAPLHEGAARYYREVGLID